MPTASMAFSPAVAPYLCETAAEIAVPPASTSRMDDASSEARMTPAESAMRVPSGGSGGGKDVGDSARESDGEGEGGDLLWRGGGSGLLSGWAGEGPRLRGRSGGLTPLAAVVGCGVATAKPGNLLLPLPSALSPLLPPARWIKLSTVAAALLLSFTARLLTAWMLVRCLCVVGDCRRRSTREGGCVSRAGEDARGDGAAPGAGAVVLVVVDGVERAM